MNESIVQTLSDIREILSRNKNLVINKETCTLNDHTILTPIGDMLPILKNTKSKVTNTKIPLQSLKDCIDSLTAHEALIRINHIGFCYKIDSQRHEKDRLCKALKHTDLHLYIEPSNDDGIWYFIGNTANWESMMIELIPIEKTSDIYAHFWLPHIQIDIDTSLSDDEIIRYCSKSFGTSFKPYPIAIDCIVYIVRLRLGAVEEVNISIDFATKSRNVRFQRQSLLKKII